MTDPRLLELEHLPLRQRVTRIAELFSEGVEDVAPPAPGLLQRRAARRKLLAETPARYAARFARDLRHWLAPARLGSALAALVLYAWDRLGDRTVLDPARASLAPEGFCGRVASLEPADILDLYARGMAPGGLFGRPAAWSPPVRAVLRLADVAPATAERRSREACRVSLDEGFDALLGLCARQSPALEATPELDLALGELYEAGFAHSLEIHDRDGVLLAGLIGVAAGGVFTIERVYAESDDAFARGVESLGRQLKRWNFDVIDFKAPGRRSALLPCVRIDRADFCGLAAARACAGRHGRWRLDADLREAARRSSVAADNSSAPARRRVA